MGRCWGLTILAWVLLAQSLAAQPRDLGDRTTVALGRATSDRRTGVTSLTATVTNLSDGYLVDLQLVIGDVPDGIAVTNGSGTTADGRPFVDVASVLPPGAQAEVPLRFSNPRRARLDYSTSVVGDPTTFLVFGPTE